MKKILLIILGIFIVSAGVVFALQNKKIDSIAENKGVSNMSDKKILIAYFSFSGNTKSIAEKIQAKTGGDIFRIETIVPYPDDYNETAYGIAKEQHDKGIKPELKNNGDVSSYDIVFIGTPAWWYEMAPAVKTFLSENNFEGKTIVPFITHGGGGKYTIAEDMAKMTEAEVLPPLVLYENGGANARHEIDKWLSEIKY